jgi:hypothetical protein
MATTEENEGWHLDKKVPLTLIAAILFQTAGFAYWAASQESRITVLENWVNQNTNISEELGKIQTNQTWLMRTLEKIENKLHE